MAKNIKTKTNEAALASPILLRREATANAFGISKRYLDKLTAEGKIPCLRMGWRCVLFDPREVEAAIRRLAQ